MKLKRLEIVNFRNVKNFSIDVPSNSKAIILNGKNGIGKSTILDAIYWLLCDETLVYGSQGSDNIDKNNRKEPVDITAIFVKDNGEDLKLRRKLTPKFTKTGEFSKYDNELEINDASYSVKQYFARIKNEELGILSENDPEVSSFNTLRCLLDYNYLNHIDYKVARNKIEKILKISKDEDLVSNEVYQLIKDDLKAQLYDVAKVRTKFNKQKEIADSRVNDLNKEYFNIKSTTKPIDEEELKNLEESKAKIEALKYEYSIEYKSAIEQNATLKAKENEATNKYNAAYVKYENDLKKFKELQEQKDRCVNKLGMLKEQFISTKSLITKCPNCNFELNGNEIKKKLADINEQGRLTDISRKEFESKMSAYDIESITKEFNQAQQEYKDLINEKNLMADKLNELIRNENVKAQIFNEEKTRKLIEINAQISQLKSSANEELLKRKENELSIAREELATIESKIELLKDFEVNKNKAITLRINEVFPNLDFRLFETSDTGAVSNTCKVYLKNVGYEGVNTGHKIILGYEILKSLRKALGVKETLPFIFDNVSDLDGENFKEIINSINCQVITACASNEQEIKVKFMEE